MKTKPLGKWKTRLDRLAPNPITTPEDEMHLHAVVLLCAKMRSGKSVFLSSRLRDLKDSGYCDRVFLICPTANSIQNRRLFEGLCEEGDLYEEPDYDAVLDVWEKLESLKAEWEEYKVKLETWKAIRERIRNGTLDIESICPDQLTLMYEQGMFNPSPPDWRYKDKTGKPRMPICHTCIDDAQGSVLFRGSTRNPLIKFVARHRHIGIGTSIWMSAQNIAGYGVIPKQIRNVCTHLVVWRPNDVEKRLQIAKEFSAEVDQHLFLAALDFACKESPHDCLFVDLCPKKPMYQFRRNFSELILTDDPKSPNGS